MRLIPALAVMLTVGCGPAPSLRTPDESTERSARLTTTHLRMVAGNLAQARGSNYNDGAGARILQGLRPDIALLQEFNYRANTDADIRAFVTDTFGSEFVYARGLPSRIPNGIVSRYPILESGDWADAEAPDRDFVWARIAMPEGHTLLVVSVHLLTDKSSRRAKEATALAGFVRNAATPNDWVVVGGDFNTSSRTESALGILASVVVTSAPWPVDSNGVAETSAFRTKPLDWLLVSPALSQLAVPTLVGADSFPNGFVADTRVYSPISALAPALTTDSAGTMQHMAVVRDFSIPGDVFVPDGGPASEVDGGLKVDAGTPPPRCGGGADVVMSQVYGGGGGLSGSSFNVDYVELHNRSSQAATVGGWTIQFSPANNAGWAQPGVIPSGTVIPAGGFLLVNMGGPAGGGADLSMADVLVSPAVLLGASGGTVALSTDGVRLTGCPAASASVVDLIGYGTASCRRERAMAPLSKTTAALRRNDGCALSGDNLSDFELGAPAPKTTQTPAVVCACPE